MASACSMPSLRRLNFGLAAEVARAEGLAFEMVMVGDDVALARMASAGAGRRGIAGTVFVHKIAGASAAEGGALPVVLDDIKAAIESIGSMGVALSPCTVPAAGKPSPHCSHPGEAGTKVCGMRRGGAERMHENSCQKNKKSQDSSTLDFVREAAEIFRDGGGGQYADFRLIRP
jgi:dihydroxyacetone kinase